MKEQSTRTPDSPSAAVGLRGTVTPPGHRLALGVGAGDSLSPRPPSPWHSSLSKAGWGAGESPSFPALPPAPQGSFGH